MSDDNVITLIQPAAFRKTTSLPPKRAVRGARAWIQANVASL